MPRKKKTQTDEQLDLIEISPPNSKEIVSAARAYQNAQAARIKALAKEIEQKQRILALVKEANLQPLADGSIKFSVDSVKISITPRDELVKVNFKEESSD